MRLVYTGCGQNTEATGCCRAAGDFGSRPSTATHRNRRRKAPGPAVGRIRMRCGFSADGSPCRVEQPDLFIRGRWEEFGAVPESRRRVRKRSRFIGAGPRRVGRSIAWRCCCRLRLSGLCGVVPTSGRLGNFYVRTGAVPIETILCGSPNGMVACSVRCP